MGSGNKPTHFLSFSLTIPSLLNPSPSAGVEKKRGSEVGKHEKAIGWGSKAAGEGKDDRRSRSPLPIQGSLPPSPSIVTDGCVDAGG